MNILDYLHFCQSACSRVCSCHRCIDVDYKGYRVYIYSPQARFAMISTRYHDLLIKARHFAGMIWSLAMVSHVYVLFGLNYMVKSAEMECITAEGKNGLRWIRYFIQVTWWARSPLSLCFAFGTILPWLRVYSDISHGVSSLQSHITLLFATGTSSQSSTFSKNGAP